MHAPSSKATARAIQDGSASARRSRAPGTRPPSSSTTPANSAARSTARRTRERADTRPARYRCAVTSPVMAVAAELAVHDLVEPRVQVLQQLVLLRLREPLVGHRLVEVALHGG